MFCFPLTSWVTIRGVNGSTVTQGESQWLDLRGFEDIVTWHQCNERTLGGAANVTLSFQTAPTKDEILFTTAASANLVAASGPVVTKVIMAGAGTVNPLARWLRWQLSAAGATSAFDATFRIWIAANVGPHQLKSQTPSPPLRENGKSCNGDCQKGGSKPIAGMMPPPRDTPPAGNAGANRNMRLLPGLGRQPPAHLSGALPSAPGGRYGMASRNATTFNPFVGRGVPQ